MLQVSKDPDEEQKEYDPHTHTHVHTPFFTFPMLANEYKPIPGRDTERCLGGVVQCRHWNGGEAPGSLLLPLNLGPTSTLSGQSSLKLPNRCPSVFLLGRCGTPSERSAKCLHDTPLLPKVNIINHTQHWGGILNIYDVQVNTTVNTCPLCLLAPLTTIPRLNIQMLPWGAVYIALISFRIL